MEELNINVIAYLSPREKITSKENVFKKIGNLEYLYHGTNEKSAKEILENGFSLQYSGRKSESGINGISFSTSKEEAIEHAEWASSKFEDKKAIIVYQPPDDLKLMEGEKYFSFDNFQEAFNYANQNNYDGIIMYDLETGDGVEELEVLIINLDKIKKENLSLSAGQLSPREAEIVIHNPDRNRNIIINEKDGGCQYWDELEIINFDKEEQPI